MIGIVGGGAFGSALGVALARGGAQVTLWVRRADQAKAMQAERRNTGYLGDVVLPDGLTVSDDPGALAVAKVVLLALPMQALGPFLAEYGAAMNGPLVACCKGVDLVHLRGPVGLIRSILPQAQAGILTGPSFASDIARGLPTALTLAAPEPLGEALQSLLSTPTLRLYRTDDVIGAELGGALKNVIAIGAGVAIGLGLGESARAALITRGYAEMLRLATAKGARAETLAGLSGLGDLILTCTSAQSRNFRFGQSLGAGSSFDPSVTVEGAATARAIRQIAARDAIDMPLTATIAALIDREITAEQAINTLLSRPLKQE